MPTEEFRAGQGYDVHALVKGRKLTLGGVVIPFDKGLEGHSDADALAHAITDALLGAAGLGDVGTHFPDHDPAYKDADSLALLRAALQKVHDLGWRVVNVDTTVIAERPKLAPHIPAMRAALAAALRISEDRVNIKGKTNEGLGYLGRSEAIEARAVALLSRGGRGHL
ncbi:MAG: 2-C-methyl-D-erythritol 2,4-cyclodiphosphate synthase [Zoogloeaceae bacterium]|jgi:2-C-methyl-D-erythritol 2,4-cyclodiphosphate synthase|nr:2-C-methyl-D-erythritol 2,4-cyclodiphosphate synthase [Zoogloeaceae bacterium]